MLKFDLTGKTFHMLTVVEYAGNRKQQHYWLCRCECGTIREITTAQFNFGRVKSCGCLSGKTTAMRNYKHGYSGTRIHLAWKQMKKRCYNPKDSRYTSYGARGITVCDRWLHSFENFLADMGEPPPNLTLERIDVHQGYSPENCRWATRQEQANNTQKSKWLTHDGRTQTMLDWSKELHINYSTLRARIRKGWSIQDALTRPSQ